MEKRRHLILVLLSVATLLTAGYSGASWYLWSKQREFIFFPSRDVQRTPDDLQLQYEEVWLPVAGSESDVASDIQIIAVEVQKCWCGRIVCPQPPAINGYGIYGHSLGGAIAIELGLYHPEAAGLILESTFTSIADIAKLTYWMFPADWLLNQRFDALAKIPLLLFIHGTADAEVPYTMSQRLFAAAQGPKWLTLIPGGGHEDSAAIGGTLYARDVLAFTRINLRRH